MSLRIRNLILILFVNLCACTLFSSSTSGPKETITVLGKDLKLCQWPVVYIVDPTMAEEDIADVKKEFEYWNLMLAFRMFIDMESLNADGLANLDFRYVIGITYMPEEVHKDRPTALAVTWLKIPFTCTMRATIQIRKDIFVINNYKRHAIEAEPIIGTVIRHEIGHVLGLDDLREEKDVNDLMYYRIPYGLKEVKGPRPEQMRDLSQRYSITNDWR